MSKAGLTANDVSIIGVGGGAAAVAAVKTGKLDAIANFDPAISLLQRDSAIKTILDTRHEKDLDYLYGGPFAASAFYADARFIERNPKTTQAFVNAISAALAWLGKASTDEIVAAVPPEYYAGDRALYRAMIESNRERVSPDGRISAEAARSDLPESRGVRRNHEERQDRPRQDLRQFVRRARAGAARKVTSGRESAMEMDQ